MEFVVAGDQVLEKEEEVLRVTREERVSGENRA